MRSLFCLAIFSLLFSCIICSKVVVDVNVDVSIDTNNTPQQHPHKAFLSELLSGIDTPKLSGSNIAETDAAISSDNTDSLILVPFNSCGSSSDISEDIKVYSSSWPPIVGENIQIVIKGTLKSTVTSGTWQMKAKLYLFSVDRDGALPPQFLPAPAGPFQLSQSFQVPEVPIHGTPTVTMTLRDQIGKRITCVKLTVTI